MSITKFKSSRKISNHIEREWRYYIATVGNITEQAVKEYIQQQKEESKKEDTSNDLL